MKHVIRIFAALLLGVGGAVVAADDQAPARVGDDTRAWLDLQASGNAADGASRPLPGEVAEKAYARYLKSFDNSIPDEYKREDFVSSGGGGS